MFSVIKCGKDIKHQQQQQKEHCHYNSWEKPHTQNIKKNGKYFPECN